MAGTSKVRRTATHAKKKPAERTPWQAARRRWFIALSCFVLLPAVLYALSFALQFIPGYEAVHRWIYFAVYTDVLFNGYGLRSWWGDIGAAIFLSVVQYFAIGVLVMIGYELEQLLRRDTWVR